jgi:hypothetical protein
MEYVDGIDLEQLVAQTGYLPVADACEFIRQAALGLAHAHTQGIVHRDIKPPNLMVSAESRVLSAEVDHESPPHQSPVATHHSRIVKILDMGLARLRAPWGEGAAANPLLTQAEVFLGTADFVAPEQALDARHADHRADLYSLGTTFYFLLTGAVPFPGGDTQQKLDRHRWDKAIPVAALRPDVPTGVGQILDKLMAKRPEDRCQSAEAIADALAPFCTPSGVAEAMMANVAGRVLNEDAVGVLDSPLALYQTPAVSPNAGSVDVGECGCWNGHTAGVIGVAFTPDLRRVYSAGQDGRLIGWDVESGAEVSRWRACRDGVVALAVSPTGRRVIVAGADRLVRVWDAEAGMETAVWPDPVQDIRCLALSGNGRFLLLGMSDGTVRLWEVRLGSELKRFAAHHGAVLSVAYAPDSASFLSVGEDRALRLWDVASGRQVQSGLHVFGSNKPFAVADKSPVNTVAISPRGRRALSAGADNCVSLWDVKTHRRLAQFTGHRTWIYSAVFAPNGCHILAGSGDKTLRYWDINSIREQVCFVGHNDRVTSVAISADGRMAVSGSLDKTVRLWRFPPNL